MGRLLDRAVVVDDLPHEVDDVADRGVRAVNLLVEVRARHRRRRLGRLPRLRPGDVVPTRVIAARLLCRERGAGGRRRTYGINVATAIEGATQLIGWERWLQTVTPE